jgi:hypothetical protein
VFSARFYRLENRVGGSELYGGENHMSLNLGCHLALTMPGFNCGSGAIRRCIELPRCPRLYFRPQNRSLTIGDGRNAR